MNDKSVDSPNMTLPLVLTCADEGVQVNIGRRLGFIGAGLELSRFDEIVQLIKKLYGLPLAIVSNEENDWVKKKLGLKDWQQVNASMQQQIEALADQLDLQYAGYLPFADPKQLKHGVKGHMVRPHKVHVAIRICFTCGGGEQTYNLGNFVLSADWVHLADKSLVKEVMIEQINFLKLLMNSDELEYIYELEGDLGTEIAQRNMEIIQSILK